MLKCCKPTVLSEHFPCEEDWYLMENRFYYNSMSREEKAVYDGMLAGFSELRPSIRIPALPGKAVGDVFFRLRLDNPEIFYVTGNTFRMAQGADYMELRPEYMFDRQRVSSHKKAIDARLEKLLRPAMRLSPEEQEKYIHDFICTGVRYDKLKKSYSHEIIGPLQNGVGVCEGIAKTVKLMCDRLGLECIIAISHAAPGSSYLHAWNIIRLGGKHYHLDATFDTTLSQGGEIRYDYYNLCDKSVFRDHRPLMWPVPECVDSDGFYYRQSRLSLTKTEDAVSRAMQALRKKRPGFLFHWRGGYLTREKLSELAEAISAAAAERGRGVCFAVNWPQAVIKLSFTEPDGQLHINTENASEEEGEAI